MIRSLLFLALSTTAMAGPPFQAPPQIPSAPIFLPNGTTAPRPATMPVPQSLRMPPLPATPMILSLPKPEERIEINGRTMWGRYSK